MKNVTLELFTFFFNFENLTLYFSYVPSWLINMKSMNISTKKKKKKEKEKSHQTEKSKVENTHNLCLIIAYLS